MITIYGASDDLIELEGDIREEWDGYDCGDSYIAFSDGTLLHITFDNEGIWRITPCTIGEGTEYTNKQAIVSEDDNSDVVTLSGKTIIWALMSFNKDDAANPNLPAINHEPYLKKVVL